MMKSARGKCKKSVLATLGLEPYIQVPPQFLIVPDALSTVAQKTVPMFGHFVMFRL